MPYLKITYSAPPAVWVKITDRDAADPDSWDDICDTVNSDADFERTYGVPLDELPDGAQLRSDLT